MSEEIVANNEEAQHANDQSPNNSPALSSPNSTRAHGPSTDRENISSRSQSSSPNRPDINKTIKEEFSKMNDKLDRVANTLEKTIHEVKQLLVLNSVCMVTEEILLFLTFRLILGNNIRRVRCNEIFGVLEKIKKHHHHQVSE